MIKRGFVTLAVGDVKYYKMALNLFYSFKLRNPDERMAILCDRENEYTREFDDVVVLANTFSGYRDKLRLLVDCPYDENIFIEPDCLVYRNISEFWDMLSGEDDFTAFGWNDGRLGVWYSDKIKEKYPVDKIPIFNPGYMFIRNGEKCSKMYDDCMEICDYLEENKDEQKLVFLNGRLRDDPVLVLGMEINGFKCAIKPRYGKCMAYPSAKKVKADMVSGRLDVDEFTQCNILHFSTNKTRYGLYVCQAKATRLMCKNKRASAKLIQSKPIYTLISGVLYVKNKLSDKFHDR